MRKLLSIVGWLLRLFRKPALTIPHPEEAPDPAATLETISIEAIREKWLADWNVPEAHLTYWRLWPIVCKEGLTYSGTPFPALTWPTCTEIDVQWTTPGVLAHEMAHVSYALLTEAQKRGFSQSYNEALATDKLLQLMIRTHPYAASSYLEAHGEVYRFLGVRMPAALTEYYPKLI